MTQEKAEQLIKLASAYIDFSQMPLDDGPTYRIFQEADTDGIYMMESEWDKYDLLQIRPSNFDELAATVAFSHNPDINPYIYTYMKVQKVQPFTYPRFTELEKVNSILSDTHGMLLWQEQKEAILEYFGSMSELEREQNKNAIKIVLREIELRKHSLRNRAFFRNRALLCYKLAYIKVHHRELFDKFTEQYLSEDTGTGQCTFFHG